MFYYFYPFDYRIDQYSQRSEGELCHFFCYVTWTQEYTCYILQKIMPICYNQEKNSGEIWSSCAHHRALSMFLHPEPGENTSPFPAVPSHSFHSLWKMLWCFVCGKWVCSSKQCHSCLMQPRTSANLYPRHGFLLELYQCYCPCSPHISLAHTSVPSFLQNIWQHLLIMHWKCTHIVMCSYFWLA